MGVVQVSLHKWIAGWLRLRLLALVRYHLLGRVINTVTAAKRIYIRVAAILLRACLDEAKDSLM